MAPNQPASLPTPREELEQIATALQLRVEFPEEVLRETDAWLRSPKEPPSRREVARNPFCFLGKG